MLWLLACAPPEEARSPRERLDDALPGLAAAAGRYTENLEAVADVVDAADPALVRLLLWAPRGERYDDALGETADAELVSAQVRLAGTVLTGDIHGRGTPALTLDLGGGPSPDLHLVFGDGWIRAQAMHGWAYGPAEAVAGESVLTREGVRFTVDLGARVSRGGAAVAIVKGDTAWDQGPAGALGASEPHAVALLVALAEDGLADPDLALAVALAYAPWRAWVAQDVVSVVDTDARERLAYGLGIDGWLAERGASWTLEEAPATAKLFWAWPGAQGLVYGAVPVVQQDEPLTLARYRFAVPDAAALLALRDALPLGADAWETAGARDDAIWADLRYRASVAGMEALCDQKQVRSNNCAAWSRERASGFDLGDVDGVRVTSDMGMSATWQLDVHDDLGEYVGDCSTATTLALAGYQSVGLVPLPLGYAGRTFEWPTHVFPLYLDGDSFLSPQATPSARWSAEDTLVYSVVPGLDPQLSTGLGTSPAGWAQGGAVASGNMSYGALGNMVDAGVPLSTAWGWVVEARNGDWVTIR